MNIEEKCRILDESIQNSGMDTNDFKALELLVQAQQFSVQEVGAYLMPPLDKPYGRKLVYQSDNLEVIVMHWKEGTFCDIHNHGKSFGIAQVLSGAMRNEIFDAQYRLMEEQVFCTGAFIYVPRDVFHRMGNLYQLKNSTTIHFYTPPIHHMEVVDLANNRIQMVDDNCGAWLSDEEKHVSSRLIDEGVTGTKG